MYTIYILEDILDLQFLNFSDSLRLFHQSTQIASINCTTGDKWIVIFMYPLCTQSRKQIMH
jgi:hypothetical protein